MADRPVSIPPIDKLERTELLALVNILSSRLHVRTLDIVEARAHAAAQRAVRLSTAAVEAIGNYTRMKEIEDAARAEGRSTRAAERATRAAYTAWRRAFGASDDAFQRSQKRWNDLRRVRAEQENCT